MGLNKIELLHAKVLGAIDPRSTISRDPSIHYEPQDNTYLDPIQTSRRCSWANPEITKINTDNK